MMDEKISMNIDNGDVFYSHDMSINFNPTQFILDFRNITPRVDARSSTRPTIALKHNVVLVDPYHAKQILALLTKVVKKYEDDYGKISKPEAMKIFEKKNKNTGIQHQSQAPTYFG